MRREISHAALKDAIWDAIGSEFLFDVLHQAGAIPDPGVATSHLCEEICANLRKVSERELFDLSIRQHVPYNELLAEGHGPPARVLSEEAGRLQALSVVTFGSAGRNPLHALQVVARWDRDQCLKTLRRLARLTFLQWAGLVCYHTHSAAPGEPPWFDLDGRLSLSDEIEAAIKFEFGKSAPKLEAAIIPVVETFAFDRCGKPPMGNGSVTVALIEFNAFLENALMQP